MAMAMMKSGAKAPKKFNPEAFRSDMMSLPPHEAADVTLQWRERAINAAEDMAQVTDSALRFTAGGGFVFLVGMLEGRQKANAAQMIEEWEAGGAEEAERDILEYETPWSAGEARDPTKFLGFIPMTLVITALPAVLGIFDTGMAPYLRSMALAGTAFYVGNLGSMAGYRLRQRRLRTAAEAELDEAAA
jgi:hypothetical protein